MPKKNFYLITKSLSKIEEYQQFLVQYNIVVQQLSDFDSKAAPATLLEGYSYLVKESSTLAVAVELTLLFEQSTERILYPIREEQDGQLVYLQTTLHYLIHQQAPIITSKKHFGQLDFSLRKENSHTTYGWDDIFVVHPLGISYQNLKKRGMKNHGRQEILSIFAQSHLHFLAPKDLNFHPFHPKRVIEFSLAPFQFIEQHPLLNNSLVQEKQLDKLFHYALGNGGFFRAVQNRRQKNYWTPGLNAGIPLVAKKDAIHELTFLVHDLCHFVWPDLIYSGEQEALYKKVYIIHRMVSEAISLVLADMLFVETLYQAGITYDFEKRKIYPLYQAILRKNPAVTLAELVQANIAYCLLGEDELYRALIDEKDWPHLLAFQKKYERFFKEDYKWTAKNYENMQHQTVYFESWYQDNKSFFEQQGLRSIQQFTKEVLQLSPTSELPYPTLVQHIGQAVLQHYQQVMQAQTALSPIERLSNSFKKYLLGQLLLCYKMDFYTPSAVIIQQLQATLTKKELTLAAIKTSRQLYSNYLKQLAAVHLLHQDDVLTYQEVYPIFDSFYVFYDQQQANSTNLRDLAKSLLK